MDGFVFRITDLELYKGSVVVGGSDQATCYFYSGIADPSLATSAGGEWVPVKFGFLLNPNSVPQPTIPEIGSPYFTCNYVGEVNQINRSIPQNAEVYLQDATSLSYKKLQSGSTWNIKDINSPDPTATVSVGIGDIAQLSGSSSNNGHIIVVPPDDFYNPGGNDYAFQINWGSDFPDEKGADLVCEYFKRQGGGISGGFLPQASVGTNGTINQMSLSCEFAGAAMA